MPESSEPIRIEYQLAEADVRHYCSGGLAWKWWRLASFRNRKGSLLFLAALVCFVVVICVHARGIRAGGLATGTILAVIASLALAREARLAGRIVRVARQMGLPRRLRLVVSRDGITEESDSAAFGSPRTFPWSEVVEIARVDHLTVVRLRPAGSVLIVPDSAFANPERRGEFEASLRTLRSLSK